MKGLFSVGATVMLVGVVSLVHPVWGGGKVADTKAAALSISQLASKPGSYLGKVTVIGRVAAVTPGKGFTLIDSSKCSSCTTECQTDKDAKQIPFVWSGAAPTVKEVVRVQGDLSKTAKGFVCTANTVAKQ